MKRTYVSYNQHNHVQQLQYIAFYLDCLKAIKSGLLLPECPDYYLSSESEDTEEYMIRLHVLADNYNKVVRQHKTSGAFGVEYKNIFKLYAYISGSFDTLYTGQQLEYVTQIAELREQMPELDSIVVPEIYARAEDQSAYDYALQVMAILSKQEHSLAYFACLTNYIMDDSDCWMPQPPPPVISSFRDMPYTVAQWYDAALSSITRTVSNLYRDMDTRFDEFRYYGTHNIQAKALALNSQLEQALLDNNGTLPYLNEDKS